MSEAQRLFAASKSSCIWIRDNILLQYTNATQGVSMEAQTKWRVEDKSENVLFSGTHDECRAYCWGNGFRFTKVPNWHLFVATVE
jgi:hypothetical protein